MSDKKLNNIDESNVVVDQEQTADITLTENMNGQTINRETFGIVVVKEE